MNSRVRTYTRNLPHIQPEGAVFSIVYRLHSSLRYRKHPAAVGFELTSPDAAEILAQAFHYFDGDRYDLYAYCIMPDHIHLLLQPSASGCANKLYSLSSINHSLKSFTANCINGILERRGMKLWASESYDHFIRDDKELDEWLLYLAFNPVEAKLVQSPQEWPHLYLKSELYDRLLRY